MTSLHLQRFIVQMSLASLSGFGQCCLFSKPEILPPAPSLIRPLQDIHTAQLLFLRRTLPPLLTIKQLLLVGLMLNLIFPSALPGLAWALGPRGSQKAVQTSLGAREPQAPERVGVQRHGQEADAWMRTIGLFPSVISQPQGDPGLLLNIMSLHTTMLNTASNRPRWEHLQPGGDSDL